MTDKDKALSLEQTLRLALEALENLEEHLPFDWAFDELKSLAGKNDYRKELANARSLIPILKAALEAKDEPEYYGLTKDHLWMSISKEHHDRLKPEFRMACYTIPPPVAEPHKRKPLTDETIENAIDAWFKPNSDGIYGTWHERMRAAIKAAHGIKGEA